MGRKRAASGSAYSKEVPRKSLARRSNSRWIVIAIGILVVIGIVGAIIFGGSGKLQPLSVLRTADYHSLMFSADNPDIVFFGHHDGIMRSDDGGKTWRQLVSRSNFDAMSLAIGHNGSHLIYLAGHGIFQVSRDGGVTWTPMQNSLPGTDIHAFTVSPEDPQRLYTYVYGGSFLSSDDAGLTWEKLGTQLPSDIMALAASGGNPETLYAGSMKSGLFRSTDRGKSWASVKGLSSGGIMSIAVDPEAPGTIFAGGTSGLYKSTDGGNSWTRLDFPGNNIAALAISPAQPGRLLVINVAGGKGEVYRSEDGGMTWGN